MHVIAFAVYGLLAGCLTAAAGFVALRLCMMIGQRFGTQTPSTVEDAATTGFLRR